MWPNFTGKVVWRTKQLKVLGEGIHYVGELFSRGFRPRRLVSEAVSNKTIKVETTTERKKKSKRCTSNFLNNNQDRSAGPPEE